MLTRTGAIATVHPSTLTRNRTEPSGMDVVTHGMVGLVLCAPVAPAYPEAAAAFMLGSVLPDADAASRVLGKRAFLHIHQTYSHAPAVILAVAVTTWAGLEAFGVFAPWAGVGIALGMVLHAFMDVTNTYGTTVLAPFSRRRFSLDWVFFIDAVVVAASIPPTTWVLFQWSRGLESGWLVPSVYLGVLTLYWLIKALLRRRAARASPAGTMSLVPSALWPWRFYGCARRPGEPVSLFYINALTAEITDEGSREVFDEAWAEALAPLPEFALMRALSPAYHVVEATTTSEGTRLLCKDLRTRNFGTRFGEIQVLIDPSGAILESAFRV